MKSFFNLLTSVPLKPIKYNRILAIKLTEMNQHNYDYSEIYLRVYCTLLAKSGTSGFIQSIPSTQDRDRAKAIAKLAGIHTDVIIEYLMSNRSLESHSIKS